MVIVIFGARLGSPLPVEFPERLPDGSPYPSGTAYEFLSSLAAVEARVAAGEAPLPSVYVFHKAAEPQFRLSQKAEIDDAIAQAARLETFFNHHFRTPDGGYRRAFQRFDTADDFEDKLEDALRQWARTSLRLPVLWDVEKSGSPFRGLQPFEARHARIYFGRQQRVRRAMNALIRTPLAREGGHRFLLIVGPSGSGKSSLARAGVIPRLTASGIVSEVDRWRVAVMRPGEAATAFAALAAALHITQKTDTGGYGQALPELFHGRDETAIAELLEKADAAAAIVAALEGIGEAAREKEKYERPVPRRSRAAGRPA